MTESFPLVSALMTFSRPERRKLALLSAKSFFRQTWPNKELVLFNATRDRLFKLGQRGVTEILLRQRTPSGMLDICFENSNGIWCALWWDDCVYAEGYIQTLASHAENNALVLLRKKTLFDKALNQTLESGSLDVQCALFPRCHSCSFDQPLVDQFQTTKLIEADPLLVIKAVRVIHE